jgi:hypothetical protein
MDEEPQPIDRNALRFGYAGLLPPLLGLWAVARDAELRWIVLAAGFGYAGFIFSFLGGAWWGLALRSRTPPLWIWIAAVAPSLIALALFFPWMVGWEWPGPEMVALAVLILLSPLVDRAMGRFVPLPAGWLRLRVHLSLGLALGTLALSRL